jgi:ketosteroid isomerase-like protein
MSANKDLITSLYAAYADGDAKTFFGAVDANVEWTVADGHPQGGTYVGIESLVSDVQSHAINDWEGFGATPSFLTDTDDEQVIMSTGFYSGTYKATGKFMQARFCHVWRVKGGKVIAFESIADTSALRRALS